MRRRANPALRRIAIPPAEAARLLRRCGFVACDGLPLEASALIDRQRKVRCLRARFDGGWKATLRYRVDGSFSISWGIKLVGGMR